MFNDTCCSRSGMSIEAIRAKNGYKRDDPAVTDALPRSFFDELTERRRRDLERGTKASWQ